MKNKAYTRLIALALLVLTLAACHEHEDYYYDPTPEVIISYQHWGYDSNSQTYTLTIDLENIGDADAEGVSMDFKFGSPTVIETAYDSVSYLPYGSRRTIKIYNLLYDYGKNYYVKLVWHDYYGNSYSTYY